MRHACAVWHRHLIQSGRSHLATVLASRVRVSAHACLCRAGVDAETRSCPPSPGHARLGLAHSRDLVMCWHDDEAHSVFPIHTERHPLTSRTHAFHTHPPLFELHPVCSSTRLQRELKNGYVPLCPTPPVHATRCSYHSKLLPHSVEFLHTTVNSTSTPIPT